MQLEPQGSRLHRLLLLGPKHELWPETTTKAWSDEPTESCATRWKAHAIHLQADHTTHTDLEVERPEARLAGTRHRCWAVWEAGNVLPLTRRFQR